MIAFLSPPCSYPDTTAHYAVYDNPYPLPPERDDGERIGILHLLAGYISSNIRRSRGYSPAVINALIRPSNSQQRWFPITHRPIAKLRC